MTTFDVGSISCYDDSVSILDPQVLVMAKAVPLAANQAAFWNMLGSPMVALKDVKYKIFGRNLTAQSGVIGDAGGNGWDDNAVSALKMTAAAVNVLTVGCVLKVESEIVVVSAINRTTNVIAVYERGAGSTAPAAHADTVAFTVIGHAGNDADLKNVESLNEQTNVYTNYCQTAFETIDYTKLQGLIDRLGLDRAVEVSRQEAMNRAAAKMAKASLLGVKRAGTDSIPGMTAGLYEQIADTASGTRSVLRYNAGGAVFSETILKAALDNAFAVGNPNVILLSQAKKNIMNKFNQAFIQTEKGDKVAGYSINKYEHEGKILDVVVDQDCDSTRVEILTKEKCQKAWLPSDLLRFEQEPKLSSRENRESLQGTYTVAIEGVGYDHCDIYGIA